MRKVAGKDSESIDVSGTYNSFNFSRRLDFQLKNHDLHILDFCVIFMLGAELNCA